ncbi:unnamed protein product [Dibothriocephalus latus]|uniref:Ig-like domain-containing protein n=1 Tax=Dibothriocephalus latus TaxID=60516 RepID=A0A3P7NU08_DIBLA|nr:unnamed protein product [Dibothriocephalus latus]
MQICQSVTIKIECLTISGIEFPPTIHDMVDQVYVSPGKGTNLTCKASGYPIPMVWWATQGTSVVALGLRDVVGSAVQTERSLTEPHSQQATLRLTDITDHSTYICIAKNTLGVVRRNISIVVKRMSTGIFFLPTLV